MYPRVHCSALLFWLEAASNLCRLKLLQPPAANRYLSFQFVETLLLSCQETPTFAGGPVYDRGVCLQAPGLRNENFCCDCKVSVELWGLQR